MWPTHMQSAVSLTFDLDIETAWIAEDSGFMKRPGPLSMAHYSPKVGIPLILSSLERLEVKATFFIPGKSAEDFPETVAAIVSAGHEIAVHGYSHDPPSSLTREEEQSQLERATDRLRSFGTEVAGYRAPLYEISVDTISLLPRYGIWYSSNLMDDIRPYKHPGSDVVELPVSWIMDDWTQFGLGVGESLERNATCAQVRQLWMEEFEAIHNLGGLFILTMHPQVIGRPSRLEMLTGLVQAMRSHQGVWIATCGEIAAQVRKLD
jgi:peptidoglycan/xylan/chitin deacetylase (PgdA/CDA1 family)